MVLDAKDSRVGNTTPDSRKGDGAGSGAGLETKSGKRHFREG